MRKILHAAEERRDNHRAELEQAAAEIQIEGERYSEEHMKVVGREAPPLATAGSGSA